MAPWNRIRLSVPIAILSLFCITSQAHHTKAAAVPALYTGNFGNCLTSQDGLEFTRFDVAYDAGNKTLVLFLDGTSSVEDESVTMHLSIDGYGTNRFVMAVDPCSFNMTSLCKLSAKKPFSAKTVLPAGAQRVGQLSRFPFDMPDYEGSAKLQVVSKSTRKTIGCAQAAMTNGRTLSQPEIVAPVLGVFTLVAIIASFLTAAYGVSIPHMRMHYAHSLSVLVVFETLQTVFFTGALSVHWPPILTAWWSNFAWSAGLIYAWGMVRSLNQFTRVNDSASQFSVGGRSPHWLVGRSPAADEASEGAAKGGPAYNSSFYHDYSWSGSLVAPGLPLPGGASSGFPGTLSILGIPLADAFMIGLIWLLVALGFVALAVGGFKAVLEGLAAKGKIKEDRLQYFRSHWTGYLGHAMLRALVVAFFMLMTLVMVQLTIRMAVGPVAVATVVFILLLIGLAGLIASGCKYRTRDGKFQIVSDPVVCFREKTSSKKIPGLRFGYGLGRESTIKSRGFDVQSIFRIPLFKVRHSSDDPNRPNVHLDEHFVKRFGWLTARYRRSRWWYLAYHVGYLFCRAAFLGGGWKTPRIQVYGVLVVDILNFVISAVLSPFEGARNTVMGVWILGICKIVTGGVATAMLPNSETKRSKAAELGIVILVFQVLTMAALLVLIVLSAVSSFLSLMRNREEMDPDWMEPARVAYFTKMEKKARDVRFVSETEPPPPTPRFSVLSIQRRPKIEDEDEDMNPALYGLDPHYQQEQQQQQQEQEQEQGTTPDDSSADDSRAARVRRSHGSHSRAGSISPRLSTGSLPRAARPYRMSWSSRELGELTAAAGQEANSRPDSVLTQRLSGVTCVVVTDCDAPSSNAPSGELDLAKQRDSVCSSGTHRAPSVSRSSSPGIERRSPSPGIGRSSREFVRSSSAYVDGKRPPTALPEAPEPQEQE